MDPGRVVFGFDVRAPFPLRTARVGGGSDRLAIDMADANTSEVGSPLLHWSPGRDNPLDASLRENPGGGFILEVADAGKYLIDPEKRHITMPVMPDVPLREARLLGLPLLLCFLARGEVSLHGAAVLGPSGAIILAAPGRHGKSSLAATLSSMGYRLLTEDLCCLVVGKETVILPGPASLRLRPDMAEQILPIDGMIEIGTMDDRVVLAASDPGDGGPVPVTSIVLLRGFDITASLRRVDPVGSLSDLWLLSFHLPTREDRARKFGQLVDLADSVSLFELTQPSDPGLIWSTAEDLIASVGR